MSCACLFFPPPHPSPVNCSPHPLFISVFFKLAPVFKWGYEEKQELWESGILGELP